MIVLLVLWAIGKLWNDKETKEAKKMREFSLQEMKKVEKSKRATRCNSLFK